MTLEESLDLSVSSANVLMSLEQVLEQALSNP